MVYTSKCFPSKEADTQPVSHLKLFGSGLTLFFQRFDVQPMDGLQWGIRPTGESKFEEDLC